MSKSLVEFKKKISGLSKNEQQVLKLLQEAGKLIVPIYDLQENSKYPGANFYPKDATKEEIEKAAKKDPGILSPYTIVERQNNKLVAVPYHVKYLKFLKSVALKLQEAAKKTENKEFSKRLQKQAEALLDGSYDEATIYWMSMKPYKLDINIGPVERYNDQLFFVKTSYQAWVGVMDEENTKRIIKYKDIILSARRRVLMPSEKIYYYDKVQTRVDDLVLLSGLIARTLFVGVNLPNDPNLMDKYGSEITLFKQTNKIRYERNLEIFNRIFSSEFKKLFSRLELEEGSLYSTALHELAHTYLRYRDSETRLKELFPIIDELGATIMGIKVCGSLFLKDIATTKQLESIMLAYLCRSFHNVLIDKDNKSKMHYILGGAIFINYLFETGAIKEAGGISWPNFTKMYVSIDELASILERLLSQGTREDAEKFIKKYGKTKKLYRFYTSKIDFSSQK